MKKYDLQKARILIGGRVVETAGYTVESPTIEHTGKTMFNGEACMRCDVADWLCMRCDVADWLLDTVTWDINSYHGVRITVVSVCRNCGCKTTLEFPG